MMGVLLFDFDCVENEGFVIIVKVDDFWMGWFEVIWDEYEFFMIMKVDCYKNGLWMDFNLNEYIFVDVVS